MFQIDISEIVGLGLSLISVSIAMVVTLLLYRNQRMARYDAEMKRVEIELLRESFERKIYEQMDRLASTEERWRDLNHLLISRLNTQPKNVEVEKVIQDNEFLSSYGITDQDRIVEDDLVFILTPFNARFHEVYMEISNSCARIGLRSYRGDEERIDGDILPHILRYIVKSRIIVANIDGRSPNVFYELGLAHALGKVTILVTSSINEVPVDLKARKLVVYKTLDDLSNKLSVEISRSLVERSKRRK